MSGVNVDCGRHVIGEHNRQRNDMIILSRSYAILPRCDKLIFTPFHVTFLAAPIYYNVVAIFRIQDNLLIVGNVFAFMVDILLSIHNLPLIIICM